MTPAATTSRRGAGAKPRGKRDDFTNVDCVVIDSQMLESSTPGSFYVHVWVDGDHSDEDNHKYLTVTKDQADWISSKQGSILKSTSWMVRDGKTWLCPTADNTQVFTTVAPDSNPFEEDDVNRVYEHEVDDELEMSDERRMAQVITQLGVEFPHLDLETRKSIALSAYIQRNKR